MAPGRRLGDFLLKEKIGEGGFGAVYRAHQGSLGRDAVVKVLHAHHVADATTRGRFLREARVASRLVHPHAAHIYAFGAEDDGTMWIAMELASGTPLAAHLAAEGAQPLPRVVGLVEQIADVVRAAHDQGIVHRDLKPANVMVSRRGDGLVAKLLDFGLARLVTAPDEPAAVIAEDATDPALTSGGAHVGSPYYMAPEQWQEDGVVDARTDQYALALLAWECLAGKPPFTGTVLQVGRAHVNRPLPALDHGVPAAVSEVLARGAAKTKDARFASVTAFATALRIAAGLGPEVVPPLPEPLRAAMAAAPQPIAEALAELEAARNVHQAIEAVRVAEQALLRYTAAIALAGRLRGAAPPSATLAALRQRSFYVEDWLALLADLLRSTGKDHPIPELAELFAGGIPAELARERAGEASGDAQARDRLAADLEDLAARVTALGFLASYPLVISAGDDAEIWMGPRRLRRAVIVPRTPLVPGHPTLLSRDGGVALDLYPVAQVAAPAPGSAPELFLLAGPGPRGARLVASPLGVERQDPGVWDWLSASYDVAAGVPAISEDPPWRGLRPYTREDAAAFHGRDEETQALANRLRLERLVAVAGPSGSGKSSLVQAGLVPTLGPTWRVLIARPGVDPIGELAALVAREIGVNDGFAARLRARPAVLAEVLAGDDTLLVVDQLEELFTLSDSDDDRRAYAEAVAAAARTARVVLTVRDDYLGRVNQLPALRDRLPSSLMLLATPDRADLERILVEPARRAGYSFDDPGLPAAMVAAVADRSGALALLSFTASTLWERRDRTFRRLVKKAYDDMGGVGGALARHAEETLAAFPAAEQHKVREAFRQLVTAEGTRAVMGRAELASITGDAVLEKLVASRLLATSDASGEDRVEIAHEALLDAWPRLQDWRRDDAAGARLRDQLRAAARTWSDRGRPRDVLWRGAALDEYRAWRARGAAILTPGEQAFAAASVREAARGRRLRLGVASAVFAVLVVASIFLYTLAAQNKRRLVDSYVDQGRQFLLADDPLRGLAYLRQALREGEDGPVVRFLIARGLDAMAPQKHVFHHDEFVAAVGVSADGTRALSETRDGKLTLWDVVSGARIATVATGEKVLLDGALSADGRFVVSGGGSGGRLWDTKSGALVALPHDARVLHTRFSPDGSLVATASHDGTVKLWSVPSGALHATLRHGVRVQAVAFSADGRLVLGGTSAGEIALWDVASGARLRALGELGVPIADAAFLGDGQRVVVARGTEAQILDAGSGQVLAELSHTSVVTFVRPSDDGKTLVTGSAEVAARVWDVDRAGLRFLLAHGDAVGDARWCGPGRIVTASVDHTLRVWHAASGKLDMVLTGHRDRVQHLACAGEWVVSSSLDLTARIFDLAASRRIASLDAGGSLVRVAASPDGSWVAGGRLDGRAVVWDVGRRQAIANVGEDGAPLASVAFGREGRLILAGVPRGGASVWDVVTARRLHVLGPGSHEPVYAELSPDGLRAVTAARDGDVTVWDLASGAALASLAGHTARTSSASFSPDGHSVVTASNDRTVRLWDAMGDREIAALRGHTSWVQSAQFSPDGARIVSAASDNAVKIWDTASGTALTSTEAHGQGLTWAIFAPSGRFVTSSGGQVVDTWDPASGHLLDEFRAHDGEVVNVVYVTEDVLATAGADDHQVRLWKAPTERRSRAELEQAMRCLVPFELASGQLRPLNTCAQ